MCVFCKKFPFSTLSYVAEHFSQTPFNYLSAKYLHLKNICPMSKMRHITVRNI